MNAKTVILIGGPTASGKTSLAIEIAKKFNTEIISADSRQCYRELNIGVARPSEAELNECTHHFIASHSIFDEVNAGVFESYALNKLTDIFKASDVAVVVGGTGLYMKALLEGLDVLPPISDDLRQHLQEQYRQQGLSWLQNEVRSKDPHFWETAEQQNPARLLRALELLHISGSSMQELRQGMKKQRPFTTLCFAIDIDRSELYQRINDRVEVMMEAGLEQEAASLFPHRQLKALQTVGYSELFSYFLSEIDLPTAVAAIQQHSRNYAKRQQTWFKNSGAYRLLSRNRIVDEVDEWARRQ